MIVKKQVLEKYKVVLEKGEMASTVSLTEEEKEASKDIELLTTKPMLFVANSQFDLTTKQFNNQSENQPISKLSINIDAQLESELAQLTDEERAEYLKELGLPESGLDKIIKKAYETLGLVTFITAGPKESKAWTCKKGTKAPQAAGKIHTDFEKGFIRAEVISWDKLLEANGYPGARSKGWLRVEGKEYIINDGDVVHFLFNN
jgi:ribosome-binding ATPase YchF (GTP1/OBG family)